jgi:O-antigen/teichoic acid export membrane protein
MSSQRDRITLNFTSILLGRGTGLFLNLFAVILAARSLGVQQYGLFAAVLSTVNILTKFIDFGFSPIVTRETSKNLEDFSFVNNAISLRIILFFFLIILSNLAFQLFHMSSREILFSNILFLNIILSSRFLSFRELLEIPFKVNLKMHIVMAINLMDNFLLLILILFIPFFNDKLLYYVIIFTVANLPGCVTILFALHKNLKFRFNFDLSKARWLLKQSLPLMGYVIFLSLFQQLDIVLTKNFISKAASGIYSAGLRLTQPFSVFPVAIVSTTIPLIIGSLEKKSKNTKTIIELVYKLLLLISLVTAIIFSFKAKELVILLFGQAYIESYKVVIILAWSNVFLFFNFFTVELLTVKNFQRFNFFFAIVIVLTDLLFFFLLCSKLLYVGVATARSLATVSGTLFLLFVRAKIYQHLHTINLRALIYGITVLLLGFLFENINLFLYLILLPLLFLIFIFLIKIFNANEINLMIEIT